MIATPGGANNGLLSTTYQVTGSTSFGTVNAFVNGTATGGVFEFGPGQIVLPSGYADGPLANTLDVPGRTYASLGVVPGDTVFKLTGSGDTVDVRYAAVPEPASASLMAVDGGAVALRRRRRA